jgi:hypothetical protein
VDARKRSVELAFDDANGAGGGNGVQHVHIVLHESGVKFWGPSRQRFAKHAYQSAIGRGKPTASAAPVTMAPNQEREEPNQEREEANQEREATPEVPYGCRCECNSSGVALQMGEVMFVMPLEIDSALRPLLVRYGDMALGVATSWATENNMAQNGNAGAMQVAEGVCQRVRHFCSSG